MKLDDEDVRYFAEKYNRTRDPRHLKQLALLNPKWAEIRSTLESYRSQIAAFNGLIESLQHGCEHPKEALITVNKSNAGNYDPSNDCYWKEMHCLICDKKWSEDQ